jgi:hypothetical protein
VVDGLSKAQTYPTEGYGLLRINDDLESHLSSLRQLAFMLGKPVREPHNSNTGSGIWTFGRRPMSLTTAPPTTPTTPYQRLLTRAASVERVIADIWLEKAGRWAAITNSSNSSTTRGLGRYTPTRSRCTTCIRRWRTRRKALAHSGSVRRGLSRYRGQRMTNARATELKVSQKNTLYDLKSYGEELV